MSSVGFSRNSNLDTQKIEFISGLDLDIRRKSAFSRGSLQSYPLIDFGGILNSIEKSLYSPLPESMLKSNIRKHMIEENLYIVQVNDSYKFRPDLLAQIFYGSQEYFHILLMVNGMKSFLEFDPGKFNNLIYMFKPEILSKL
jgi:hypothetical protein